MEKNSAVSEEIFMKFGIRIFLENLSREFNFHQNLTRITAVLYMKTSIHFFIISGPILFRMGNVSDKICRENQNTHFTFSNFFPKIASFMR